MRADELSELRTEVARLRAEVTLSHATSAAALSRATRVAQLVSALVQLTDPAEIMDRAAGEVAEQFGADVAVFLVPVTDPPGMGPRLELAAHWGIPNRSLPIVVDDPPDEVRRLEGGHPTLAGTVEELGLPPWLADVEPRHLAWGQLSVRGEQLGYLLLARRGDEPFVAPDVKELGLVVSRIALAVDNGRLYTRTQEQVKRLRRLHEVTASLAGTLDVDRVVESLARTVVDEVPVAGVGVYLAGKAGLELAAEAGAAGQVPATIAEPTARAWPDDNLVLMGVGGPPVGALLLTGRPARDTEADSFLQHVADLGSLIIGKSLLFERIRTQAESDPLTGLPNRALLMQRLESTVSRCRETGADLAVIFVDLDDFKAVNDTYGHDVGDQLLMRVADRLTGVVGPDDTVSRLGGDEFVVVRANIDGTDGALAAADEIRSLMATPFEVGEVLVDNQASVGIAMASTSSYHAKSLMRDADAGMYADKVRDHHRPPDALTLSSARPRPSARGTALALRRRARWTQHQTSPRPGPEAQSSTVDEPPTTGRLRTWCDGWRSSTGQGLHGPAAEAVQRILAMARDHLEVELTWLSRFVDGRQVFEGFDGDPARFDLRHDTALQLGESYCLRVLDGGLPSVINDTLADDRTARLDVTRRHHLGAYVGVPVYGGSGELFGMLCAVSREAEPSLGNRDAKLLRMLASLLTEPLSTHGVRAAQASAFVRNALSMLDAGGMSVALQPIVDLATGQVASVESLARFATYPYSVEGWFAQAHQAGCGSPMEIDAAVLATEFLERLPDPLTLAINASPDVASSTELLDLVTRTDPARIVVEITEHRRATEPSLFASSIRRLQARGVQVAIDDAGTGYSDLKQILELQPDIIKLDRTLVAGVERDPVRVALVQAFVAFAKDTGMSLIAEGVSTHATGEVLRDLAVGYGQGYALGAPEPAPALVNRLASPSRR